MPTWTMVTGTLGGAILPAASILLLLLGHDALDKMDPRTGTARAFLLAATITGAACLGGIPHRDLRVTIARAGIASAVAVAVWLTLLHAAQRYGWYCTHSIFWGGTGCGHPGADLGRNTFLLLLGIALVGPALIALSSPKPKGWWFAQLWRALGSGLGLGIAALALYLNLNLDDQAAISESATRGTVGVPGFLGPMGLAVLLAAAYFWRRRTSK